MFYFGDSKTSSFEDLEWGKRNSFNDKDIFTIFIAPLHATDDMLEENCFGKR